MVCLEGRMWAEGAGECLSTSAFGASKGLPWGLMVFFGGGLYRTHEVL